MHHWASVQCNHPHSAPKMPGLKSLGMNLRHSSRPPGHQLGCHWSGNTSPHCSSQILFSWMSSWLWCFPLWAWPEQSREIQELQTCEIMCTSTVWGWIIPAQFLWTPTSNTSQHLKEQHKWREFWRVECYIAPQMERKVCWSWVSKWLAWHRDAADAHVPMSPNWSMYKLTYNHAHLCLLLLCVDVDWADTDLDKSNSSPSRLWQCSCENLAFFLQWGITADIILVMWGFGGRSLFFFFF